MATIRDVAGEAGVSIATVSRVLNGKGKYTDTTFRRVMEAVDRLHYASNAAARSLKTGVTGRIGLCIRPYHMVIAPGILVTINDVLNGSGFSVEILQSASPSDCLPIMREKAYDGLLLLDPVQDETSLGRLISAGSNIVLLGGETAREDVNIVEIHFFQGGYRATKELIRLGHREILFIEDLQLASVKEIKRGYLFAHDENGIQYRDELIVPSGPVPGTAREQAGRDGFHRFFESSVPFSAVLTVDDRTAYGVISAAQESGTAVPDTVSVIGFGDTAGSSFHNPPLTTVKTPLSEMCELGCEILVNNIRRGDGTVKRVRLTTQLVRRMTQAKKLTP